MKTRMSFILAAILLLGVSAAQAQTTCPTAPTSNSVLANTTMTVQWCSPTIDTVTGANAYGFPSTKIPVNGITALASYGDGKTQYQGTLPGQPVGSYTVTLTAVNCAITGQTPCGIIQEGTASTPPFSLTVVNPAAKPGAPSNVNFK